ncbi:hypothetical protein CO670_15370 [Rhizobium sp. J15]|uniref:hypothetical protein n=1 Tax=Rhizobium sp. J15 TaxID=2035450 RepID=UPI000BE95864|nr:hypothetical protein [Rhizobium sp. J15]PDT15875.1 hypothetical protein CO670_15370 [Rhizobium sp. J15]
MSEFTAGQEFKNAYPFVRGTYSTFDEEGEHEVQTWNPGVRYEAAGYWGDETEVIADGNGFQILTVVDVHKPGKYPTRVFYTVSWVRPDGRPFGKKKLHIATVDKFRRLSRGFHLAYAIEIDEVAA